MQCNGCGRGVDLSGGRRLGFSEVCEGCATDLHSCLHCAHHDPAAYNECRESSAERVSDRARANRCEYFRPREGSVADSQGDVARARAALDALFRTDD